MPKTAIIKYLIILLVFIEINLSCLNLLSWQFFINYKEYLVIVFIILNSMIILLNAEKAIKKHFWFFILSIFCVLIYMLGNTFYVRISIQELGSAFLLINLLLTWINFNSLYLTCKQINFFIIFLSLYGILFLIINWNVNSYNPNTLATFSFPLLVYICIFLQKYIRSKILFAIVFIIFFYFAYKNECRSVLIGEIVFLILLCNKLWIKNFIFKSLLTVCILGQIILPIIWTRVWMSGFSFSLPFLKKSLYSGRESVWMAFLEYFYENPIWGTGNGVLPIPLMGYRTYTPHNFMFCVLVVYGVIVFVIVAFLLYQMLNLKQAMVADNRSSQIALSGLLAILVVSFFEIIPLSYIHVNVIWFLLVIINTNKKILLDNYKA